MSRYQTNRNGYIGHSEVFTSIEAEEIGGVSGSEPLLVSSAKSTVETLAATATLTTAQSGSTFLIGSSAAVSVFTLPTTSTDTVGVFYRFVFNAVPTVDITIAASAAHLNGSRLDGTAVPAVVVIAAATTILFDVSSTAAVVGDSLYVVGLDATHWYVKLVSASTTGADIVIA